jgi:DNA-binding NarL/FixJ family response regulator
MLQSWYIEVAQLLISEGLSNAALAARLDKSPKTIANQLSSIYAKLGEYFGLPETPDRTSLLVLLGRFS